MKATKEADSKYSEKIKKLTAMYHDKSLSRKEKQEVRRELNHLKYLADPRPAISMRKQTVLSIVAYLIMTVNFISATVFGKKHTNSCLSYLHLLFLGGFMLFFCFIEEKYKHEPDDELSLHHRYEAGRLAAFVFLIIAVVTGYICFDRFNFTLTLSAGNWGGIFLAGEMAYFTLSNIIFLILEGREPKEDE